MITPPHHLQPQQSLWKRRAEGVKLTLGILDVRTARLLERTVEFQRQLEQLATLLTKQAKDIAQIDEQIKHAACLQPNFAAMKSQWLHHQAQHLNMYPLGTLTREELFASKQRIVDEFILVNSQYLSKDDIQLLREETRTIGTWTSASSQTD